MEGIELEGRGGEVVSLLHLGGLGSDISFLSKSADGF